VNLSVQILAIKDLKGYSMNDVALEGGQEF